MLHHVSLECRREDAAAHDAFWCALGFAAVEVPPSLGDRAAWYGRDGTQVHLLWTEAPVVAGHVAVVVDDLDALGLELEERERHWGERRVSTRAPGGHAVELFEVPPQSHS